MFFLTVKSHGVSHDPKEFLKMVPGQKWKSDILSLHFYNKKEGLQVATF